MHQHLAAVKAAATIADAVTTGVRLGSQALAFEPGETVLVECEVAGISA